MDPPASVGLTCTTLILPCSTYARAARASLGSSRLAEICFVVSQSRKIFITFYRQDSFIGSSLVKTGDVNNHSTFLQHKKQISVNVKNYRPRSYLNRQFLLREVLF